MRDLRQPDYTEGMQKARAIRYGREARPASCCDIHVMANRLVNETSPYLLQHAHNPVDWYPWGEDAFARARAEDKPVFLSIGYSACHWCHVMERESFENEAIAELLNREFVSIKVDREERPDVDSIYMTAVQMISGQGGWPMSMFLTPAGQPFWGGTYFPPEDKYGRPGFPRVLQALAQAWKSEREKLLESADHIVGAIRARAQSEPGPALTRDALTEAANTIARDFDAVHGGFGSAPKFPPSMSLEFLLQVGTTTASRELTHVVMHTLRKMGRGGMFDQIGGGFHRYSVDERWLVPHFEKMLYDNALLSRIYLHAWMATGEDEMLRISRDTIDWVLREMTSPEGGFYSSLDADSEGEEGKFYVWSRGTVLETLGQEEGSLFCALYDITESGNFEGHNIPNVPREPSELADSMGVSLARLVDIAARGRCKLFGEREKRVRPGRDEKILAGWNGWMLAAISEASIATGEQRYLVAARANADFLLEHLVGGSRVLRSFKDGRARIEGVLEDYAGVAWGLLHAFEATGERRYLDAARALAEQILERFVDPGGGFFDTPSDGETLITRPKDVFDNATPSGNSLAAETLAILSLWFDDDRYRRASEQAIAAAAGYARRYPSGFGFLLSAAGWHALSPREIVITGHQADPAHEALVRAAGTAWVPHRILLTSSQPDLPLARGRDDAQSAAYICHSYACRAPVHTAEALLAEISREE